MRGLKGRLDYILKHNLIIQRAYKIIVSLVFRFIGIFVRTNNKMILFSAHGGGYNDSPKAIFQKIVNDSRYNNYEFVWALDYPEKYHISGCTKVKIDTAQYFVIALKSKYWVSCVNIERGLHFKKKDTVYLNTWHGTPLKFVGNAVNRRNDFDFSSVDFFCCAGQYEGKIHVRDLNVSEDAMIYTGLPRNDYLYHYDVGEIKEIKKNLGLPLNKKIILYAPTWRDSKDAGKSYSIKPPINLNYWKERLGGEYVLLFRTHPYTNKILGIEFNEFIRDYSTYPDINNLLVVSDLLISDYSSLIFDFSILGKPIFCFGYDYHMYSIERGLYIDLEKELPGGVVKNEEQLIKSIVNMDYKEACRQVAKFNGKYIEFGGNATEQCVDILMARTK